MTEYLFARTTDITSALASPLSFGTSLYPVYNTSEKSYDLTSSILTNTIGAKWGVFGSASKEQPSWLETYAPGVSFFNVGASVVGISPNGTAGGLFAARNSDNSTASSTTIPLNAFLVADNGTVNVPTWIGYGQAVLLSTAIQNAHYGLELSVKSSWTPVTVHPYSVNTPGSTRNLRLDAGVGGAASTTATAVSGNPAITVASATGIATGQVIVAPFATVGTTVLTVVGTTVTMSANALRNATAQDVTFSPAGQMPVSCAMDIVQNGQFYGTGINFGAYALDTTGGLAPALALAYNYSVRYYANATTYGDLLGNSDGDTLTWRTTNNSGAQIKLNVAGTDYAVFYGSAAQVIFGSLTSIPLIIKVNNTTVGTFSTGGALTLVNPTGGLGYGTGAGGTVTQGTSKVTGVTLNTINGEIVLNASSLNDSTNAGFLLTNSAIAANDHVHVEVKTGGTADAYAIWTSKVSAGSCRIVVRNVSGGTLAESFTIGFAVIRGSVS